MFLLGAEYNGTDRSVYLKFYDDEKIIKIKDRFDHKPYCYTRKEYEKNLNSIMNLSDVYTKQDVQLEDLILNTEDTFIKISAPDPLKIGGNEESIRNKIVTWESDIKYYERYLYDNEFICGLEYDKDLNAIYKDVDYDEVYKRLGIVDKKYKEYIDYWVKLLNQPIPDLTRLAVDIEVEFDGINVPSIAKPDKKIIAVGFSASNGSRYVLVLNENNGAKNNETTFYYKDETVLINAAFEVIKKFPIIITYNGDSFDLPYLFARSLELKIKEDDIPFTVKRKIVSKNAYVDPVYIKNAVHLDLYRFFKNKSIQNYAFSHKYNEFSLDAVCKGILNESKLDFDFVKDKDNLQKMADYCLNDADLTLKLTTFNDNLLVKLMLMLSRLSKLPLDDVCRYGVNQYSRALFYSEMIKKKMLIPRADEILVKGISASQEAIIKEKKFKGAYVAEPKKGVHFDVNVLDYSSLYPSIIKAYNISFETVNCIHNGCKKNKIPETENWTCKKVEGITSLIIGSLRDLRVNYYKYMTKKEGLTSDEQQLYDIVSQTLKVFLNGSYGVLGFEQFPLYCLPAAEAVTAYGRNIITRTIKHAEQNGISVVYGDTDSMFATNADEEDFKPKIDNIIKYTNDEFKIDLEVDKHYRFLILTELKKNYLGILDNSKLDIKGLTGKKAHTPIFIQNVFYDILSILSKVNGENELDSAREEIKSLLKDRINDLRNGKINLDDLSFTPVISKDIDSYGKKLETKTESLIRGEDEIQDYLGVPQHIKAAKMMENVGAGSKIKFIKTRNKEGVKPTDQVKSIGEVDIDKYIDIMDKVFSQVLSALKLEFIEIVNNVKQTKLDDIFWPI